MRRIPLLFLTLLPGAAACAAPPGVPFSRPPLRWRLGEQGRVLVLEPEPPERSRVEVRVSQPEAPLGAEVEAEIRLPGGAGRRRITVRPGRPGVRILGLRELVVEGEGPVRVRFTAESPGPGGIVVELGE